MTFARDTHPCFGCDQPMHRCICDVEVCAKCRRTVDDYGYCGCKSDTGLTMADVEAQMARVFLTDVEVKPLGDGWNRWGA